MNESVSFTSPGRLAHRAARHIRRTVRWCCFCTYLVAVFLPLYTPRAASVRGAEEYLTSDQFLLVEEGFVMKTASISEQGHRMAYSSRIVHRVGSGETLHHIADLYDLSLNTLLWANDLSENAVIHPDDELVILPVDGVLHTVRRGQSLTKIASLYSVSMDAIIRQNQIQGSRIVAGERLIIPGGSPLPAISAPATVASKRSPITPAPPRPTQPPAIASPPPSHGVLQKPCDCTYTQYYHPGHYAVDMSRNGGGPIFAAADGIVTRADFGWNGGYGNVVEIDHGNGLQTLYAHNREIHVREGSVVRRGDVVATMGNTGRTYGMTGIHLHFEIIQGGVKKNPLLYLQ